MNSLEKEVTKYMITADINSAEAIESAKNLVQIINEGSAQDNLLHLIQCLGEHLTNEDEFIRAKATGLLSITLTDCEHDVINESAVSVLVDFYCERLTDKTCVQNLLQGLVALTTYSNFTDKNAVFVSKRIAQKVDMQQFPQAVRYSVYNIYSNLINRHVNALRSINNEFVYGFTQKLDGEKDPRNLLIAFQIMKNIVNSFDISAHVEDIFEVTCCYFPITFKPPPDDPYGITAEDLKISLRECISSSPLFAKFALPLILEKLSSTAGSAKKDSMETLAACAPVYGAAAILPHIDGIFSSLKLEVFQAVEPSLEDAALKAIHAVVNALNTTGLSTSESDPVEKALQPLIEECTTNLKDPDMKDSKQTGRILRATASASDHSCHYIVNIIIPLVLKQYRETSVAILKKANVDIIIDLLEACKTLYGTDDEIEKVDDNFTSPLIQYKDQFFAIFESSLKASNEYNLLRLSGLTGLKLMIISKRFLEENEVGIAIQSINSILLDEQDEELRSAALNALSVTSHINSKYVNEITILSLVNRLPDTTTNLSSKAYLYILHALEVLAPVAAIYKQAMPLLIQKFDHVCEKDTNASYALAIAQCILSILNTKSAKKHDDIIGSIDTLVSHFITKAIEASLCSEDNLILDYDVMETLALITITVFSKLNSEAQKAYIDKAYKLFVEGQLSEFDIISSTQEFQPLNPSSSPLRNEKQKKVCLLFAAIVCCLRKDVNLPVSNLENYLNEMVQLVLSTDNVIQANCGSRMIGSLINKWKDNSALIEYVKTTTIMLESIITQQAPNSKYALMVYLWIAKALILRTHAMGYELTNKVIEWCADNPTSIHVPQGFDILIGDDKLALNKNTFATTSILFKQRFFAFCLPKLIDGFRSAADNIKPNYLIALSYVLKNVPKQILLNELPPLVSTLATFKLAVAEASNVVAPQVRTILPSLLALLQETANNPIRVRVGALACLAEFPGSIAKDILKPHVNYVIRELRTSLDDKKRIVRKEAVECRSQWYTVIN
ncbi:Dos2-interacting transcription regulator of RNA-Pol-II-domain-containing protein [Cokeromyces recurvatus]|uniref:Dos2-interacting transcription regulator of RNA-Pol-II-domain-containing protein n=1 Tax=Cokeromyces recurvatus TaxID=90255 RepID=UPI0022206BDD|nr:Dos2-interacting transcription regulator of RNA-Pol-II-domain-containing protein [Cokeromyces recurvatus]KAI7907118.1 Dos2-interacting transcription regulator of RNA-Pol-II-domain-containing protein [Cokeromyces recurvatus]